MRNHAPPLMLLAVCALALAGCEQDGGEAVTGRLGSDRFSVGGMVNLAEPVEGDAILAGGHVKIASQVEGDLVVAGGEVSVGGSVGDDLYAAGGEVSVDAIVSGNARVAGGEVEIGPATMLEGGASITGGRIDFDGSVASYLQATAGEIRLNGTVGGDAVVRSGKLQIAPGTRIDGKLVYRGPEEPVVPEGATIAGGIEFQETHGHRWADRDTNVFIDAGRAFGSMLWFVGVFAVAALFTAIFPAFSTQAATLIGRDPWVALGLGLAVLVCMPFVALVLLITIIGIPLALLLAPVYLLLMFLGWVTAALFLGQKLLDYMRPGQAVGVGGRILALLVALTVLWLLRRIPYAGPLIGLAALSAGIGALVWQLWSRRERAAATPA